MHQHQLVPNMHQHQLVPVLAKVFNVPTKSVHLVQQMTSPAGMFVVDAVVKAQHGQTAARLMSAVQAPIKSIRVRVDNALRAEGAHFQLASTSDAIWVSKPLKLDSSSRSGHPLFSINTTQLRFLIPILIVFSGLGVHWLANVVSAEAEGEATPLVLTPTTETAYKRALRQREAEMESSSGGAHIEMRSNAGWVGAKEHI
jgi:hypothetical protein